MNVDVGILPESLVRGLSLPERKHLAAGLMSARLDPAYHARAIHGWDPFEDQRAFLRALDVREGKVKTCIKRAGRGYGKTKEIAEIHLELAEAAPGVKTLAASRSQSQAELSIREINAMLNSNAAAHAMFDRWRLSPYPILFMKGGSQVHFCTLDDGGEGRRGSEFDLITVDEAGFIGEEVWSLLIALLRKSNGPIIGFSTPGEEWFDELFDSLEDRRRDGDESVLAWSAPATLNPHLAPDYFARARADMPEMLYRREILAEPVGGHLHTFRREHLEKVFDKDLPSHVDPVGGHRYGLGWDLAVEGAAVGIVADCTARELVLGVHAEKHSETHWPHVKARIEDTVRKYPGRKALDATGLGGKIGIDTLHVHVRDEERFIFTAQSRYALCLEAMKFVEDRASKDVPELLLPTGGVWVELRDDMRKHKLSMAKKRDSKSLGEMGGKTWDALDAFMLMVHAVNTQIRYRGTLVEAA